MLAVNPSSGIFLAFEHLPLGSVVSVLAIVVMTTSFMTSANDSTLVLSTLATNGNPNLSAWTRVIWGFTQSALALTLLLCSDNGLDLLQSVVLVFAFPFLIAVFLSMYSLVKCLRQESFEDEKAKSGTGMHTA